MQNNVQAALDRLRQSCAAIPNEESEEVRYGLSRLLSCENSCRHGLTAQDAKGRLDLLASRLRNLSSNVQQSTHGGGVWVKGVTCFTAMSRQERARVLMKPNVLSKPANATVARPSNGSVQAFNPVRGSDQGIDWRLVNGKSFVTPVRDQGDCGTGDQACMWRWVEQPLKKIK